MPFIIWLGETFPFKRRCLLLNGAVQMVLSIMFAAGHMSILKLVGRFSLLTTNATNDLAATLSLCITDIIIYWEIIATCQIINHFRKLQECELGLMRTQMEVLKMQIQPHFLFNTINIISELIYEKPEVADQILLNLSNLLRFSIKSNKAQEITLKEELDLLSKYLEIQQTHLGDRLKVKFDISRETLNAGVPNMILQLLAENAVSRGIAPSEIGGRLEISAKRAGKFLILKIQDNGLDFDSRIETGCLDKIGFAETRTRLQQLYGNYHQLEITELDGGGVLISMALPFLEITADDE